MNINIKMEFVEKLMKTLKKVIEGWDILEFFLAFIFFPLSLLYILFRVIQEWEVKK